MNNFNLKKFLTENKLTTASKLNEQADNLFTFGFDMDAIEDVVDYLEANYTQGPDYQFHIGRGDDMPNAVTLKSPEAGQDAKLLELLDDAKDTEEDADSI